MFFRAHRGLALSLMLIALFVASPVLGAKIKGTLSLEDYYATDSSESEDRHLMTTRFRFDAKKLTKNEDFSFHFDARLKYDLGASSTLAKNERISTLYATYTGIDKVYLAAGRLWTKDVSVERVDGVNLLVKRGSFGVGAFGGTKPDTLTEEFDSDHSAFGGYLLYRKRTLSANLAATQRRYRGDVDREYIRGQVNYTPKKIRTVRFFGSFTSDWNQNTENIDLTNVMGRVTFRPSKKTNATLSYSQFRPYQLYASSTTSVVDSKTETYYLRVNHRLGKTHTIYGKVEHRVLGTSTAATLTTAASSDVRQSNSYLIGFRDSNLLGTKMDIDLNASYSDSETSDTSTVSFKASRYLVEKLQLVLKSSYSYTEDTTGSTDVISYGAIGYWNIKKAWRLSVTYDGRHAEDLNSTTVISRLTYKF